MTDARTTRLHAAPRDSLLAGYCTPLSDRLRRRHSCASNHLTSLLLPPFAARLVPLVFTPAWLDEQLLTVVSLIHVEGIGKGPPRIERRTVLPISGNQEHPCGNEFKCSEKRTCVAWRLLEDHMPALGQGHRAVLHGLLNVPALDKILTQIPQPPLSEPGRATPLRPGDCPGLR
jgi:hypothetical protein